MDQALLHPLSKPGQVVGGSAWRGWRLTDEMEPLSLTPGPLGLWVDECHM